MDLISALPGRTFIFMICNFFLEDIFAILYRINLDYKYILVVEKNLALYSSGGIRVRREARGDPSRFNCPVD